MTQTKHHIVLFVDDENPNRVVFKHAFGDKFNVETASSGSEALEIMKVKDVAVLVTDQRMPQMSGNELLERAKDLTPNTVRIVATAYSDLEPILQAVNDGLVARYVVKPWKKEEFERVLAWAVDAHTVGVSNQTLQMRLIETERLVTLGGLSQSILHDLRQPLMYIAQNSQRIGMLAEGVPGLTRLLANHASELEESQVELLDDLVEELADIGKDLVHGANLADSIITQLHEMTRPQRVKDARYVERPHELIEFVLSMCCTFASQGGTRLVFDAPALLPPLAIGEPALARVLINLINNASEAHRAERPKDNVVTICANAHGDRVQIRIIDNGPGMSDAVLAKADTFLFTTKRQGTGLGLSHCRRLIEGAQGTLNLESQPAKGTTVTVDLPTFKANP